MPSHGKGKQAQTRTSRTWGSRPISESPPALRGARIRANPDRPKLSEALADLVSPFTTDDMKVEHFRVLVGLGAIAWNLSLLEDSSPADLVDLVDDFDTADREYFELFVSALVSRKRSLFPDDERFVAGWDVAVQPDGSFFVTAAGAGIE